MMTSLFFGPAWPRRVLGRWLPEQVTHFKSYRPSRWAVPLLSLYVVIQLLLPLRHWLYPLDTALD